MEAFDQPWKAYQEGAVGSYWGVYDVNRNPKFEFHNAIVRVPEWHVLAAISIAVALLVLGVLYLNSDTLRNRGRSFLALVVYTAATIAVWVFYDFTQQYMTVSSVVSGVLLLLGMLGVILVLLAEAHEWAEAHWVNYRRRLGAPVLANGEPQPKVSIHVPAYNEPPEMVIETLDALARLDYSNYEVLVIDNNTRGREVSGAPSRPIARALGERFRFFHVAPLQGFKAGALNFALARTAPDAKIVAVIDSDYVVDPNWLRELVPGFQDPRIAIVQAPQDYRDEGASAFKAMCYAEYRGFFHIGMITRNERNAIIQHGTMTMVRRAQLDAAGWAEWCITEDAELGLRIFEAGFEATYVPTSYGRGLMPDTFIDFKKQRFRWAYGAMQILKRHARAFFMEGGPLSAGQRYHFVAGWLPWVADGCNMLFNVAALGWSAAMVLAPQRIDPPLVMYSVLPLSLFTFKLAKLVHLYRVRVGANFRQTVAAAIAGLALTHTIGTAVVKGLFTRSEPFFRTPKGGESARLLQALAGGSRGDVDDARPVARRLGRRACAAPDGAAGTGPAGLDRGVDDPVGALRFVGVGVARERLPAAGARVGNRLSPHGCPATPRRRRTRRVDSRRHRGAMVSVAGVRGPTAYPGRLRAIASMLVAVAAFAFMDATLKLFSQHYPPMEIAFLRGLASLPFMALPALIKGRYRDLKPSRIWMHLLRGVLMVIMLAGLHLLGAHFVAREHVFDFSGGAAHCHGACGAAARRSGRVAELDRHLGRTRRRGRHVETVGLEPGDARGSGRFRFGDRIRTERHCCCE